jgi:hypothetical protein
MMTRSRRGEEEEEKKEAVQEGRAPSILTR